ncbi:9814_t:CDS:10 [Diversispora eburnea]|uniref:9814_t:CDS:1 n=3 Tax=Diversisporales TaxID=214509 RepID=A0A9N9A541_9GLOM|nr:9814_t:CDS:10 [Diversispora eburnea]
MAIWAVHQNNQVESTTSPKCALFRLRNLKGPIDEVALSHAILLPHDIRENFDFEVSEYDGTAATVRISFKDTTHEHLVQRLSIFPGISNLSVNGFYDWLPLDSTTIQCMHPHDGPIPIEAVDRMLDQIDHGEEFNARSCLPLIFPGTTLTSNEDDGTSIVWGEDSIRNLSTTINTVNFLIFASAKKFVHKGRDSFLVLVVRILNTLKSIPILGKTIMNIEESIGGKIGGNFFKEYYQNLDQLLIELEQALGEIIISLTEDHFRQIKDVISRILLIVKASNKELDALTEYVSKMKNRKEYTDIVFKGAIAGVAVSAGIMSTFVLNPTNIAKRFLFSRTAALLSTLGFASISGAAYLLSNHYKKNIARYEQAQNNLERLEKLLTRMENSNDYYFYLNDNQYPGKAEILIDLLNEFKDEICHLINDVIDVTDEYIYHKTN